MTLHDLKNGTAQLTLMAKRFSNGVSSTGNAYTKVIVRDMAGNETSLFDWNGANFNPPSTPVLIEANVTGEEKNGSVLYRLNSYMICNDQRNLSSFFPPARINQDAYTAEFCNMTKTLRPELRELVKEVSRSESGGFKRLPLSETGSYAVTSGILEATVHLSRLALNCADMFPDIDRDLLLAGSLLYYMGYTKTNNMGYSSTKEEILSGGGMNTAFMIHDAANSLAMRNIPISPETVSLLYHIVTSRTGDRPTAIIEAVILRDLDHMLRKVDEVTKIGKSCPPGETYKVGKGVYYQRGKK